MPFPCCSQRRISLGAVSNSRVVTKQAFKVSLCLVAAIECTGTLKFPFEYLFVSSLSRSAKALKSSRSSSIVQSALYCMRGELAIAPVALYKRRDKHRLRSAPTLAVAYCRNNASSSEMTSPTVIHSAIQRFVAKIAPAQTRPMYLTLICPGRSPSFVVVLTPVVTRFWTVW